MRAILAFLSGAGAAAPRGNPDLDVMEPWTSAGIFSVTYAGVMTRGGAARALVGAPSDVARYIREVLFLTTTATMIETSDASRVAYLERIEVEPGLRRRNIGGRLLDAMIELLVSLDVEVVHVLPAPEGRENAEALDRFYRRHGFEPRAVGSLFWRRQLAVGRAPLRENPGAADRLDACGAPSPGTARRQVPALLRAVPWKRSTRNADVGGGPWPDASAYLKQQGVENIVIDPGWQTPGELASARAEVRDGAVETATLANVLNVLPERASRREVLAMAANAIMPEGVVYISVYEGNRSGRGGATRDGWQANRLLASYEREVREFFGEVRLTNGRLEARAPRDVQQPPMVCAVR